MKFDRVEIKAFPSVSPSDDQAPEDVDGAIDDVEECARRLELALASRYGGKWTMMITTDKDAAMFVKD